MKWAERGKRAFRGVGGVRLKTVASHPAALDRCGGGAERVGFELLSKVCRRARLRRSLCKEGGSLTASVKASSGDSNPES